MTACSRRPSPTCRKWRRAAARSSWSPIRRAPRKRRCRQLTTHHAAGHGRIRSTPLVYAHSGAACWPITPRSRSAPISTSRAISPNPSRWSEPPRDRSSCARPSARAARPIGYGCFGNGLRYMPAMNAQKDPRPARRTFSKPICRRSASARGCATYFLTGLVVAGPLAITAWLIWSFITWVDDLVRPLMPAMYRPETYLPWQIPGSGLVIAFFALTLLGFLTANLVGRTLLQLGENRARPHADRAADLQDREAGLHRCCSRNRERASARSGWWNFRRPACGRWCSSRSRRARTLPARLPDSDDQISVFLPCTPNPTTGFFFYVPRKNIIELDIPVEAAATLLMSAGMIQPGGEWRSEEARAALGARADARTRSAGGTIRRSRSGGRMISERNLAICTLSAALRSSALTCALVILRAHNR